MHNKERVRRKWYRKEDIPHSSHGRKFGALCSQFIIRSKSSLQLLCYLLGYGQLSFLLMRSGGGLGLAIKLEKN